MLCSVKHSSILAIFAASSSTRGVVAVTTPKEDSAASTYSEYEQETEENTDQLQNQVENRGS